MQLDCMILQGFKRRSASSGSRLADAQSRAVVCVPCSSFSSWRVRPVDEPLRGNRCMRDHQFFVWFEQGTPTRVPAERQNGRDSELDRCLPDKEIPSPVFFFSASSDLGFEVALERVTKEPPCEGRRAQTVRGLPLVVGDELRDWKGRFFSCQRSDPVGSVRGSNRS